MSVKPLPRSWSSYPAPKCCSQEDGRQGSEKCSLSQRYPRDETGEQAGACHAAAMTTLYRCNLISIHSTCTPVRSTSWQNGDGVVFHRQSAGTRSALIDVQIGRLSFKAKKPRIKRKAFHSQATVPIRYASGMPMMVSAQTPATIIQNTYHQNERIC